METSYILGISGRNHPFEFSDTWMIFDGQILAPVGRFAVNMLKRNMNDTNCEAGFSPLNSEVTLMYFLTLCD